MLLLNGLLQLQVCILMLCGRCHRLGPVIGLAGALRGCQLRLGAAKVGEGCAGLLRCQSFLSCASDRHLLEICKAILLHCAALQELIHELLPHNLNCSRAGSGALWRLQGTCPAGYVGYNG